jgi:hypothetical protein
MLESHLKTGLRMIPLADRRRYFCLLSEGTFSPKKFEDLIVNVAYALGYMDITRSQLPAGTGIKQIAGMPRSRSPSPLLSRSVSPAGSSYRGRSRSRQPRGKSRQSQQMPAQSGEQLLPPQLVKKAQVQQSAQQKEACTPTQVQTSLLRKAAPYIMTSVGVIGLAASFIATQMATQEMWKTYNEDVERCSSSWVHIIGSALSLNTGRESCLIRAEGTRAASQQALALVSGAGYAIFTGLVTYGLNIRQGGSLLESVPGVPGTLLKLANTSIQYHLVQQAQQAKKA